jgi:hypothetical protein
VLAAGLVSTHDTLDVLVLVRTLWRPSGLGAGCLWPGGGTLLKVPTSQPRGTTASARGREPCDVLRRGGGAGSRARSQARVSDVTEHHGAAGARVPPRGRRGRHKRHAARKPELQRGDVGGLTARPEEPRRRRTQHPGTHGEGVVRNNNGIWFGGDWPPLILPLIVFCFFFPCPRCFFFAARTFLTMLTLYDDLRQEMWQQRVSLFKKSWPRAALRGHTSQSEVTHGTTCTRLPVQYHDCTPSLHWPQDRPGEAERPREDSSTYNAAEPQPVRDQLHSAGPGWTLTPCPCDPSSPLWLLPRSVSDQPAGAPMFP